MARRRTIRRAVVRPVPRWAAGWCVLLAALLAMLGVLPLMHEAASHGADSTCAAAFSECGRDAGLPGPDGAHPGGEPVKHRGACDICRELVLVKQVIPWQAPVTVVLPERPAGPEPERSDSRPLEVWRRSAPARGPPLRA